VKIQIVSFICLRARKTKRYGQRVPIVSYYVESLAAKGGLIGRKGGKFDNRPGRRKAATPLTTKDNLQKKLLFVYTRLATNVD